ncbi:MAG: dipeptidase PepV [Bacillota bacterium]
MKDIDVCIDGLKEEIISSIQSSIAIKSVEEKPKVGMPFGEGVDRALRQILKLGEDLGFRTKYGDGYYGYVEMGEGEEMIGILGHIDVVPEGDPASWSFPPYGGEVHNGRIYGRGAIDDKGPTIAALYAMKIVRDSGYLLKKRIRLIIGANEETRWECIDEYKEQEEAPSCGFTPDADYPLIFAEKGLLQFNLEHQKGGVVTVFGGNAYNSVPDLCRYHESDWKEIARVLDELGFDYKITDQGITILGKACHSSTAWKGINAISRLCMALTEGGNSSEAIRFVAEKIGEDCYGEKIVGDCEDQSSGKLTMNIGKIDINHDRQTIYLDVRYPVTKKKEDIIHAIKAAAEPYGLVYEEKHFIPPLYVPRDHSMVKLLRKVYEEETGLDSTPLSIGGATYARAFENFVAFGPLFPGKEEVAHEKDEYIEIDDLMKTIRMYAKVIAELAK